MNVQVNDAREAIRRLAQAVLALVAGAAATNKLWRAVVFPQDDPPWLLIGALLIAFALPLTIWWRQAVRSKSSAVVERTVGLLAVVAGLTLLMFFGAWAGFLLTGPFAGPMSAEATIYFLALSALGSVGSLFLLWSPLLLDGQFFAPAFRRRAWMAGAAALPILFISAVAAGPRLGALFG